MKISLILPKGHDKLKVLSFLGNELAEAQNIKDKKTMNQTIAALRKIKDAVLAHYPLLGTVGKAFFSDGTDVIVNNYNGITKTYHCGKQYIEPEVPDEFKWLLACFDANNLYIGEFNGKNINMLYAKESLVPRKHCKGGQSKERFARGRDEALKHWLKEIAEEIEYFANTRPIWLACNMMYKHRIEKYLSNNLKVEYRGSVSIDDNCLWELAGVSRYT